MERECNEVIAVNGVTKRFGVTTAVDDISFSVPEGELFGFLGPNGAGKTTTIRMLTGIWCEYAREHSDCRRLSGTVWAEKSEQFAFGNAERDVIYSGDSAESLCQSVNCDHVAAVSIHFFL